MPGQQVVRGRADRASWLFLHMLGSAPDLDVAFESEQDRDAARTFMDLLAASEGEGET